jgi:pSer/pThr/pTyr-binding forkhead associated (FHA) protein
MTIHLDTETGIDTQIKSEPLELSERMPSPMAGARKLVLAEPDDCQTEIPLVRLPLTIGRGREADIRLTDRWISRQHCVIDRVDGQLTVRDLESANGTLVNRSHVAEAILGSGDRLTVGMTTFVVRDASQS